MFGIKGFGSTSEQRKSAREFAKENNGEVNGLFKKSINVTYSKYEQQLITHPENIDGAFAGGLDLVDKKQNFNSNGSLYDDSPSIRQYEPSTTENWSNSENFIAQTSYSIANSLYTVPQLFTQPFTSRFYNIDGSEQKKGSDVLLGNFISGATSFLPTSTSYARVFVPKLSKLNAAQFSKITKGTIFSSMKPAIRGSLNRSLNNNVITPTNGFIQRLNTYIASGQPVLDGIDLIPSDDKKK